jgi:hypothetical protein
MAKHYGVVEVVYKPTGEKRLIKWDRFNPELHKKVGDVFSSEYAMDYDKPVHTQVDLVSKAVAEGEAKRDKKIAEKLVAEKPEKVDNDFDAGVELDEESLGKLKFFQLRKYATHRGIQVEQKDKKAEVMAKIRDKSNISNPQ